MKIITSITLLFFAVTAFASQKAITDKGDVVILKDNGSWVYEDDAKKPIEIVTNKKIFKKSSKANFELKSVNTNVSIFIDPTKWTFEKEPPEKSGEYSFENKKGNAYGTLITEKLDMSLEQLANIAVINAKEFAPDTEVTKKEYRTVNGKKLIYLEMKLTTQGIDFNYFGYYFSNKMGSNQLVTYALESSIDKSLRKEIEVFLNGLSTQQATKESNEDNTK